MSAERGSGATREQVVAVQSYGPVMVQVGDDTWEPKEPRELAWSDWVVNPGDDEVRTLQVVNEMRERGIRDFLECRVIRRVTTEEVILTAARAAPTEDRRTE